MQLGDIDCPACPKKSHEATVGIRPVMKHAGESQNKLHDVLEKKPEDSCTAGAEAIDEEMRDLQDYVRLLIQRTRLS